MMLTTACWVDSTKVDMSVTVQTNITHMLANMDLGKCALAIVVSCECECSQFSPLPAQTGKRVP